MKLQIIAVSIFVFVTVKTHVEGALQCNALGSLDLSVNDTAEIGDVIHVFDSEIQLLSHCPYFNVSENGTKLLLTTKLRNPCAGGLTLGCTVSCQNGANTESRPMVVKVKRLDIYDPSFPFPQYNKTIMEGLTTGTEIFNFDSSEDSRATDEDCTSLITYHLTQSGGGNFSIIAVTSGKVVTNGTIFYDMASTYTLRVVANSTGRTAETTLVVTVRDVDDKNPAFSRITYHLNVTEEELSPTALTTSPPVLGYDQDVGINATILYAFKDKTTTSVNFSINTSTGQLTQLRPFDRETMSSTTLEIMCYQADDHGRMASAFITVTVLDINDNLPEFLSESLDIAVNITENYMGVIATVTATDKDEGDNAIVHYRLLEGEDVFEVGLTSGVISVKDPGLLDRERVENITIIVQAVDLVGNVSAENASVLVRLLDLNDNSPEFKKDLYGILFNTSQPGTVIGKLVATDADVADTPNSNVTYHLTDTWIVGAGAVTQFPLSIDTLSGDITITGTVTVGIEYNMFVRACDNPMDARNRRCSNCRVQAMYSLNSTGSSVEVSINITIHENVPQGTVLGQLPLTGDLYNITTTYFIVDQHSHMLKTNSMLDREISDVYNFSIHVMSNLFGDIGNISVTVTVLDVNDNQPMFRQPEYFFTIPLQGSSEMFLGTLEAEDDDIGENSNLTYYFNKSPLLEWLSLDSQSGNLTLSGDWWESGQGQTLYVLNARVRDNGVPSLHSNVQVFISTLAVHDNTSVVIKVDALAEDITKHTRQLEIGLAKVLGFAQVTIQDIKSVTPQHSNIRSELRISAKDDTDEDVSSLDLARHLVDVWYSVQALFHGQMTAVEHSDTALRVTEIALIVVGGAILLGGAIAVPLICRQWNRHVKEHQLYDHLRRPSTLYDSQELRLNFSEENPRSQFSSFRSSPRKEEASTDGGSFGLGYINQVFVDDDNIPKTPTWGATDQPRIPRWSTTDSLKDVMASLENLSSRLNAEDSISAITQLSRGRSLKSNKSGVSGTNDDARVADWHATGQDADADYITPVMDCLVDEDGNTQNDKRMRNGDVAMTGSNAPSKQSTNETIVGDVHLERPDPLIEESTAF